MKTLIIAAIVCGLTCGLVVVIGWSIMRPLTKEERQEQEAREWVEQQYNRPPLTAEQEKAKADAEKDRQEFEERSARDREWLRNR